MNQHKSLSTIINKLQRKELLLHMEYNYEKETFKQQTEAMGIDRKVKRGMCWYPVSTGRSYYNSLNQLVIEVERQEDNRTCIRIRTSCLFFHSRRPGKHPLFQFHSHCELCG